PFAMHCDNRNLKIIPNVLHHIRHLYLQFNSIEAASESSFLNATSLTEINLSHNKIKSSAVNQATLKDTFECFIDYATPNLLTYIRIDQNKLKDQLNNFVYARFPRIQIIYYEEQKIIYIT
ncbi:OMD protein, partial [Polyodon spathula]|nr:OMD protein [Polyodon spathula]